MMKSYLAVLVLAALAIPPAAAQSLDQFERILLPVAPGIVRGALGSEWWTTGALTNLSDTPLLVSGFEPASGCGLLCGPQAIPPHATIAVYNVPLSREVLGATLLIEKGRTSDLAASLRVRDLSRQKQTWGTSIPVVTEARRYATTFGLVDIPLEPQFRATLRIYDADARTPGSVRVRIYAMDPRQDFPNSFTTADKLLLDRTMIFTIATEGGGPIFLPGSIELPLDTEPALAGTPRIRIEITPLTSEPEYWAFVSITHNETQHVTLITP